ncbi:MAG: YCF48-related protein, partial [Ignavibacteriaceae bacterium]|nr:YCF48-related protein [Ignavibacteriaceae bacterium]
MIKKIYLIIFLFSLTSLSFSQNFWERIQSPTDNFLRTLHFTDSLRGWVAGDSGSIFYTSDGGLNWVQQQSNTNNKIMRIFFLNDDRAWALAWADVGDNLFFGTEILKTTDGGENW